MTKSKKVVYVPRNWKVSYTDGEGNVKSDVVLRANAEYRIVSNGNSYIITPYGVRTEEDRTFIHAKIVLNPGYMHVMSKSEDARFNIDTITEITPVKVNYVNVSRSIKDTKEDAQVFTFAFDTAKYSSQYRLSVYAGEFVALAIKDPKDPNKKTRSIYGHIVDVNSEEGIIRFVRYVCKHGVRDVYERTVSLESLLGIYRYELTISEIGDMENDVAQSADEGATEEVATSEE